MLIANGSLYLCNPMRAIGTPTATNDIRAHAIAVGALQNQATLFGKIASVPYGYYIGSAWIPPRSAGALGSKFKVSSTLNPGGLIEGRGIDSTITGLGSVSLAIGKLLVGAAAILTGHANLTLDIAGVLAAEASITGNSVIDAAFGAIAGAIASIDGASSIVANPYAEGYMDTEIKSYSDLSPEGLASAVWNALAATYNTSGTMGGKVNSAASAGDPWSANLPGSYIAGQAGYILAILQAILKNKMVTDPVTGIMTIYADDDTTELLTAQLWQDAAGTIPYSGKGAERREALE